jgi:hypothetical protein
VPVRLKVDENLPCEIADLLNEHGYDARTVLDQGWQGMADHELWQGIQAEGRWLITADKGFADLRLYPPVQGLDEHLAFAALAIERVELDRVPGAVIVVTHRGIRIRSAPA